MSERLYVLSLASPRLKRLLGRRPMVLFVDDHEAVLNVLRRIFATTELACELMFEASSPRALEHIQDHAFEVVVSDFSMPIITGDLVLARVAALQPRARRIMITSTVVDPVRSNAHCIVPKPCEVPALRMLIRSALSMSCDEFVVWSRDFAT